MKLEVKNAIMATIEDDIIRNDPDISAKELVSARKAGWLAFTLLGPPASLLDDVFDRIGEERFNAEIREKVLFFKKEHLPHCAAGMDPDEGCTCGMPVQGAEMMEVPADPDSHGPEPDEGDIKEPCFPALSEIMKANVDALERRSNNRKE